MLINGLTWADVVYSSDGPVDGSALYGLVNTDIADYQTMTRQQWQTVHVEQGCRYVIAPKSSTLLSQSGLSKYIGICHNDN